MGCTYINSGPFAGYCEEDLANWQGPTIGGKPALNTGGVWYDPTASPPKPLAAETAYTGVPRGEDLSKLAANPLANPFDSFTANLQLDPCGLFSPGSTAWQICKKLGDTFQPGTGTGTGAGTGTVVPCPSGYHKNSAGVCVTDSVVDRVLPGDIGKPDVAWTAVNGRYGAGTNPVRVQSSRLACPPGFVLGKDSVCYDHLARTNRKHNPGARPLLTGGDMNALRKAKSLEKRWRKVAPAFHKKVVSSGARLVKGPRRK